MFYTIVQIFLKKKFLEMELGMIISHFDIYQLHIHTHTHTHTHTHACCTCTQITRDSYELK